MTALVRSFNISKSKGITIRINIRSVLIFIVLILIFSCQTQIRPSIESDIISSSPEDIEGPSVAPSEEDHILQILNSMSLKEKIGQLFILDLKDKNLNTYFTEMDENLKKYILGFKPGGVILFSDNIHSNQQVKKIILDLQSLLRIPLFVAVDEEGGRVSRLNSSPDMNVLEIPSHEVLGSLNDTEITLQIGRLIGEELRFLGFNMNFAPVADINSNYKNPVLGDRSFSDKTEIVSTMVESFVQGMQESGVCSVIKHFPGHGATDTDPHNGEVSINLSLAEIRQRELVPFKSGISKGAGGVMTAHIKTPKIIETAGLPATLSSFFIKDILRNEMDFNGLVISDSFSMAAIKDYWLPAESSGKFILAGGDIILRPTDVEAAMGGIVKAVENGVITVDRINKSVIRILEAKFRFGLFSDYITSDNLDLGEKQFFLDDIMNNYKQMNINK